jgi:hypothetical protein
MGQFAWDNEDGTYELAVFDSYQVDDNAGKKTVSIYVIGDALKDEIEWQFYNMEEEGMVEGTTAFVKKEIVTLEELIFMEFDEDSGITKTDWYNAYIEFLKYHNLHDILSISEGTFENFLLNFDKVVSCNNTKYRYYDFSKYDFDLLLSTINLESYEGLNVYTTLFFRKYKDLMDELADVLNEKAGTTGKKTLAELVEIAKSI